MVIFRDKKLKGTVKSEPFMQSGKAGKSAYGFAFSENVKDWIYADTQFGRNRRKRMEKQQRA